MVSLERKALEADSDIAEILNRTPTEMEHNRALEKSIAFQLQLETLLNGATRRFNETLVLFDHYSEGLGTRLRQAAEALIEAESKSVIEPQAKHIEAPSTIPDDLQEFLDEEKIDPQDNGDIP